MEDIETSNCDKFRCSCDRRENEQAVKKARNIARRRVIMEVVYNETIKVR
jgi:hypothetical protein